MTRSGRGRGEDGLTAPPQPVTPSAWLFPKPENADEDGVVGVGADLEPGTLVEAYRSGIFPWPHPGMSMPWFSPHPRGIVTPATLHVSRSLRRTLRHCGWHATVDHAFTDVIRACADRHGDEGTWITPAMMRAYERLHRLGWTHSVEVWDGDDLVGGLYGVLVGGCFTGESMFHLRADAIRSEDYSLLNGLLKIFPHRPETVFRDNFAVRTAEM
jgi:leucyl/phenylalanyl-tRNA---protein transferase